MSNKKIESMLYSLSNSSRKNRLLKLAAIMPEINKTSAADQHGIFQHFQSNVTEYATRERHLSMRGGEHSEPKLYGVGPEHEDSSVPTEYVAPSLSTRYSPDHIGVQAQRVSDGVYKDPYTNKVYDYNEGFKTDSGIDYPGGHPALQSQMTSLGAKRESAILKKVAKNLGEKASRRLKEIMES